MKNTDNRQLVVIDSYIAMIVESVKKDYSMHALQYLGKLEKLVAGYIQSNREEEKKADVIKVGQVWNDKSYPPVGWGDLYIKEILENNQVQVVVDRADVSRMRDLVLTKEYILEKYVLCEK